MPWPVFAPPRVPPRCCPSSLEEEEPPPRCSSSLPGPKLPPLGESSVSEALGASTSSLPRAGGMMVRSALLHFGSFWWRFFLPSRCFEFVARFALHLTLEVHHWLSITLNLVWHRLKKNIYFSSFFVCFCFAFSLAIAWFHTYLFAPQTFVKQREIFLLRRR